MPRLINVQKEIIQRIRARVPVTTFVGSIVPTTKKDVMIIVINAGGTKISEVISLTKINVMVWGGKTWEESFDLAIEVDYIINGLNDLEEKSQIINIETSVLPVPSGDGERMETPVYSCSYDVYSVSENY